MSEVKILITAQTAEAGAAIQSFAQNSGAAFKVLAASGATTHEALTKVRETSMLTREAMRGLETAALLSGNRLGGEFVRGTMLAREGLMGMRTAAMLTGASLPIIGTALVGLTTIIATGATAWMSYSAKQKEALSEIDTTTQIYAIRNRLVDLIDTLMEAKKLSAQSGADFRRLLNSSEDPKTLAGNERFVQSQLRVVMPNKDEQKALEDFTKVQDEAVLAQLDGINAERVKITRKEDELLAKLDDAAKASHGRIKAGDLQFAREQVIAAADKELSDADQKEVDRIFEQELKDIEEIIKGLDESIAADKKLAEELKKRAALKQEIARAQTEAGLTSISNNPLLSEVEKNQQSLPLYQQQMGQNSAAISDLQGQYDETGDLTAQLEIRRQIAGIMVQQAELQSKINTAQGQNSFRYNVAADFANLKNSMGTVAQNMAGVFTSVFAGLHSGLENSLSKFIMYGGSVKQMFSGLYVSVAQAFSQSVAKMASDWIMQHVIMAAWDKVFAGTSLATHTAAETAKTGATGAGSVARGALRFGETLFHGVMVGIRTANHIAGEIASTAVTLVQAGLRAVAWGISAVIGAISAMASIPYVGPILAVAAAAGMAALVASEMGAFEEGGFTGAGGRSDPAGIVHRGEYVFSAPAVNRLGLPLLNAMHSGSAGGSGGGSSPAGKNNVSVYAFTDPRQMSEHLQKNDAHEKWVVDVMSRNMHKFR